MSSRAQQVPLVISHAILTYEDLSLTEKMFPVCIPHTKELTVRTIKEVMGHVLKTAFALSLPLLMTLDLRELSQEEGTYSDPDLSQYVNVHSNVCFPPSVFEHTRLERLRLQGIPVPRAVTSFRNLVSLSLIESIQFDGDSEEQRLAPSDINLILQGLPKLQKLLLHRCFLGHNYSSSPSPQRVHLNDLKSLDVHDSDRAVRDILEGLVLPHSSIISLHMWTHDEDSPLDGADPIASIFGGPLAAHVSAARRICTVSIDPGFSFENEPPLSSLTKIMAWPINLLLHGPVDLSRTPHHPYLSLSWDYSYRSNQTEIVLSRILDAWDTSHVEALLLHHVKWSWGFSRILPDAFSNVQQISLYGFEIPFIDAPGCLDALRAVLLGLDSEEVSHRSITFPRLTYLSMHFEDSFQLPACDPDVSQWRYELLALLEARRAIRNYLPSPASLHFIGWPKTMVDDAKFLRKLKGIVPEVRSDPMGGGKF